VHALMQRIAPEFRETAPPSVSGTSEITVSKRVIDVFKTVKIIEYMNIGHRKNV
jgi:hypothetical protein